LGPPEGALTYVDVVGDVAGVVGHSVEVCGLSGDCGCSRSIH
jgi:hypothetical protein